MLKQVSLLLTCVSGHVGILILISKWFLFRQQKDNQPSTHVTARVCRHAQTGQSSARWVSGHVQNLLLISKRFLLRQRKENQPQLIPHVTPRVCRHAQTGQPSAHLRVLAYRDLESHFKVVSVPAPERLPTFTSCHPSSMSPCSNRSVFCSPACPGIRYRDLDSHFNVVSVLATEREPTFTSCHPSSMPPCSNRSVFCSPVCPGISGS
jgi:hypothetical protein